MTLSSVETGGTLTLIGSGEMSPSMGKAYRAVMSMIANPLRAAFLDTPAGFELNADRISAKAVRYFQAHLQTDLSVVSFKSAAKSSPVEVERALDTLQETNFIFAGPGSPTYAIRNWRDTAVFKAVCRRLAGGAHLVLASAAAIAVGRYALPVYEIYKVGDAPHWVEGLNLLGPYGFDLAIVPHWNNGEGGTHDTRHCFIGEPRFRVLERCLGDLTTILGIDEYTACILDLRGGEGRVMGAGKVTVRRSGWEAVYPSGTSFELDQLKGVGPPKRYLAHRVQLSSPSVGEIESSARDQPSYEDARSNDPDHGLAHVTPYIDLLVAVRAQLRANEHWDLADQIRQGLSALGIVLQDGPTETTWRQD